MRSPPQGEKWWGFRSDFAARFSPACLTGCGREMAQHSGIVGQGHTQTRSHRQPICFVDVNNTPAAPKYCGAASGWPKPPATLRAAAGFDVAGPLLPPAPIALTLHCRRAASGPGTYGDVR
jgi:hypothetical protein